VHRPHKNDPDTGWCDASSGARNFGGLATAEATFGKSNGGKNNARGEAARTGYPEPFANKRAGHRIQSQARQKTAPEMTQPQSQSVYHSGLAQLICNVVSSTKAGANSGGIS
jgi:hypothetical protein